ncbi:MAG: hypothetical protein IID39_00015 [Planctomycetes bacterium]|nr:hypothetical protein [Planctomycetota bacterium]
MEKTEPVDQKLDEIQRLVESRPDVFQYQGSVVESWREYEGKRLGPYFRLAYRDGNRQRSVYLGRSVQLADAVRKLLEENHQGNVRRRELKRLQRSAKAQLREARCRWEQDLRKIGLYLHGCEVRGWRLQQQDVPGENVGK